MKGGCTHLGDGNRLGCPHYKARSRTTYTTRANLVLYTWYSYCCTLALLVDDTDKTKRHFVWWLYLGIKLIYRYSGLRVGYV